MMLLLSPKDVVYGTDLLCVHSNVMGLCRAMAISSQVEGACA